MAAKVSASIDTDEVEEGLKGIQTNMAKVRRRSLTIAARGTRRAVVARIRASTRKRTGELQKAYRYKVRKDASSVSVYPKGLARKSRIFPKAMTLSWGSDKTRHQPRGFVQQGELYAQSGAYMKEIEQKVIQEEIVKYWEG